MTGSLIKDLTDALYEAADYAIPPQMVDQCSLAAVKVIRAHFLKAADEAKFGEDAHAYMCAVEELDEQTK